MNAKNITKSSGFSLIELMVVIAIVALLAAVAVPSYKSYIAKSRTAEINSLVSSFMENWDLSSDAGTTPTSPTGAVGNYIASLTYNTGGFVVVLDTVNSPLIDPNASGATLTFLGTLGTTSNVYTWTCDAAGAGALVYDAGTLGIGLLNTTGTVC